MKAIILAGGSGTRLFPVTSVICKQLLPVYNKPLIYYPLSTVMMAGIREILIISTPKDLPRFEELLGSGRELGLSLSYKIQDEPRGLADAFIVGKDFIGIDKVCLALGDNIFFGNELISLLKKTAELKDGANIFGYYVNDPERYGVVEFDKENKVISLEEKPRQPKSHYAVVGLYFYDNNVISIAENLKPSPRGELEITDVNKFYLNEGKLNISIMGRGFAWLDTGTHNSLHDAASFIRMIEERQGLIVACLEEIAYRQGFINKTQLLKLADGLSKSGYGKYLYRIAEGPF